MLLDECENRAQLPRVVCGDGPATTNRLHNHFNAMNSRLARSYSKLQLCAVPLL